MSLKQLNKLVLLVVCGISLISTNANSKGLPSAPKDSDFYDNGMPTESKAKLS